MDGNYGNPYTPANPQPYAQSELDYCMQRCGCYNYNRQPAGANVTMSGRVYGVDGRPASYYPMSYSVNGNYTNGPTDASGRYAITGSRGSTISATPLPEYGLMAVPATYSYANMQTNQPNRDFRLRPTIPGYGQSAP